MARRLRRRPDDRPTVIDVFSGVGGLSLGAARAGFEVVAAVDNDSLAIEAHTKNFPDTKHVFGTARTLSGKAILDAAGLRDGELDGLIGGPPCQGFSAIGYRSSRDVRNNLFAHFFRLVSEARPKFFVAENVPGILGSQFSGVIDRARSHLGKEYSVLNPFEITASDYGTPTKRTRVFFVGFRIRSVRDIDVEDFAPPLETKTVFVSEALRGLPIKIDPEWQTEDQGFRAIRPVHPTRFLKSIHGRVPPRVGDPHVLEEYMERGRVSGCLGTIHAKDVVARFRDLKPGERDPISKAARLRANGLCPTIRAGTSSDRGSYQAVRPIHYKEPRVITPREGARLQGFPDWFSFHPTKWHSFRQIGNSVSPIVAEFLLRQVHKKLG